MNKKLRVYIFLILFSSLLSLLTYNRINVKIGLTGLGMDATMLILLYALSVLFLLFNTHLPITRSLNIFPVVISLFMLPATIFLNVPSGYTYGFIILFSIPIAFLVGKKFFKAYYTLGYSDLFLTILLLPAIVGIIWTVIISTNLNLFEEGRDYVFSIIIFLPLVYFYRKSSFRVILLLLFAYIALVSTKRTALIMVILSFSIYFVYYLKKIRLKDILILLTILAGVFFVVNDLSSESLLESLEITQDRMNNFDDKSNEARKLIYTELINQTESFDFFELMFGHGYNAVSRKIFGHPAHNDYLELAYDYGFLVALLYVMFILKLLLYGLKQTFSSKRSRFQSFYLVNAILLFIVLSMVNCIVINPTYIFVSMLVIGWSYEYTKINSMLNVRK